MDIKVEVRSFLSGASSRVALIRANNLRPSKVTMPARLRARELGQLMGQRFSRTTTAIALPPLHMRARKLPQELQRGVDGEEFLSLRSALNYWLFASRLELKRSLLRANHTVLDQVLYGLQRRGLLAAFTHHVADTPPTFLPVGALGHLRQLGTFLPGSLLFNTHFFLLDPAEVDSCHAAIGDPIGLLATSGRIHTPAIAPRAALVKGHEGWAVARVGLEDMDITLPCGTVVRPGDPHGPKLFTRGPNLGRNATPQVDGMVEVCLVGHWPVAIARNGGYLIPHGGIVLSWEEGLPPLSAKALKAGSPVTYSCSSVPGLTAAVQGGPLLLQGGEVVIEPSSFAREAFHMPGNPSPTVPMVFPTDAHETPAARVGVGITQDKHLLIVIVEGASTLADSSAVHRGSTLLDLATLLLEEGAHDALNLDGGGSTLALVGSGSLVTPGDHRNTAGAAFDRPVPVGLIGT